MFCPNCGTQLEDGALFCGSCGAKIAAPAQTAATSSAASAPAAPGRPLVSFKIGNMDFSIVKENIYFSGLIAAVVAFIALFLPYLTCKVDFLVRRQSSPLISFPEQQAMPYLSPLCFSYT